MRECMICAKTVPVTEFRAHTARTQVCNMCRQDVIDQMGDVARHHVGVPGEACTVHHWAVVGERLAKMSGTTLLSWWRKEHYPQPETRHALATMASNARRCARGRGLCWWHNHRPEKMPDVEIGLDEPAIIMLS